MSRLTTVTAADVAAVRCPYCQRCPGNEPGWADAAMAAWGWCGFAFGGPEPEALLLLQPEPDGSALINTIWARPAASGAGHGKALIQAAAAGLVTQRVRLVHSRGSRQRPTCTAPPRDFLRAVGFTRGLENPLWQLDLDRTVARRTDVLAMLARFVDSLRPVSPPNPAVRSQLPGS